MIALAYIWLRLKRRWHVAHCDRAMRRIQREAVRVGDRITQNSNAIADLRREIDRGMGADRAAATIEWLMAETEADRAELRRLSTRAVDARAALLRACLVHQTDGLVSRFPAGLTD